MTYNYFFKVATIYKLYQPNPYEQQGERPMYLNFYTKSYLIPRTHSYKEF
ncbi:hypothetical protein Q2T41_14605 [Maribacter confluentis]|uniref:Uncharacterized protein n=1 Tax=Maribacter confluentis TaxID=1656093 RepID=A0ABT8RSH8_9FLAO|nr:hypothetical protein [Maribacter confluentis]MDO1513889.1 hypothetical protein [Maribacter confluentis]